jgi:hypothetical protein
MTRDIIGLLVVAGFWGGWELCATYGKAAREVAKYRAEIAAKNSQIAALNSTLERERAAAESRAAQEDKAFSEALPGLGKCILDEAQADALNKIGAD